MRAVVLDREELARVTDHHHRRTVDLDRDQLPVAQLIALQNSRPSHARGGGEGRFPEGARSRAALQRPGEGQQPRLGHVLDRPADPLAAKAGVLQPAVRHVVDAPGRDVIDDHAADLQLVVRQQRALQVVGEDAALQAELRGR